MAEDSNPIMTEGPDISRWVEHVLTPSKDGAKVVHKKLAHEILASDDGSPLVIHPLNHTVFSLDSLTDYKTEDECYVCYNPKQDSFTKVDVLPGVTINKGPYSFKGNNYKVLMGTLKSS